MCELLIIWILSVHSSLFALILIERHRSQNKGSLKSEERFSNFKERCAQLWGIGPFLAETIEMASQTRVAAAPQVRISTIQPSKHGSMVRALAWQSEGLG